MTGRDGGTAAVGSGAVAERLGAWLRANRRALGWLAALTALELLALGAYLVATGNQVTALRYLLYPFVWVNASVLAVRGVSPPAVSRRVGVAAGIAGAGYFLLVARVAGLVGLPTHRHGLHAEVFWLPPGWGPLLAVHGPVTVQLVPFKLVGYLALAYLVSATVRSLHARASGAGAIGGVVGLGSCVSCAIPLASGLASGLLGGSALLASAGAPYDLSTAVFLVALLLLRRGATR